MSYMTKEGAASCLAIGSAGEGVGGYSKYKDASRAVGGTSGSARKDEDDYGLLATKQDIEDFKEWARKCRYDWFGSIEVSGHVGKTKEVVNYIHDFFRYCKSKRLKPIIYYSGHGDEDGDWVFPDDVVTFDDVERYNNKIDTGYVINVISDCCFSGRWVQQSNKKTKMNVLAASAPDECALDRIFAQAFFKGSAEHTEVLRDIGAVYTQFQNTKGCVIKHY